MKVEHPKPCLEGIFEYCTEECPYRKVLSIFGKRYTLSILRVLFHHGVARFNKIANEVGGSPKTITDRLVELCRAGIVKREAFAEIPPRVEYSMTKKGLDLKPVMDQIRVWGMKWIRVI